MPVGMGGMGVVGRGRGPQASAATISDPTTSEDVQAGLRREAAAKRASVTSTVQRSTGGSLGTSDSPTLSLLGSP